MPGDHQHISNLYPDLTPEELREAGERLREYVEVIIRIAHRVQHDPEKRKLFCQLTGIEDEGTLNDEDIIEW